MSVTVRGATALPPTFDVHLNSAPGGVTFRSGGDCHLISTTEAACSLASGSGSALLPGRLVTAAAVGTSTVFLPVDIPTDQPPTELGISVTLPKDFVDPDPDNNTSSVRYSPSALLVMGPLVGAGTQSATVAPKDGKYELVGSLTGMPASLSEITFLLTGDSTFEPVDGCTVAADGHELTCKATTAAMPLAFGLTAPSSTPSAVSITVEVPDGYTDTSPSGTDDNWAPVTLVAAEKPAPSADLSLTDLSPDPVTLHEGVYTVTASITGFPKDSPDAVFTVVGAGGTTISNGTVSGDACSVSDGSLVCKKPSDGQVTLSLTVTDPTKETAGVTLYVSPLAGYDDADLSNNTSNSVTLLASSSQPPTAAATISVPPSVVAEEDGTFNVPVTVSGLPDAYAGGGTFTVTSGSVTVNDLDGCTDADTHVTCDTLPAQVSLHVVGASVGTTLKVTLSDLDGYADPTPPIQAITALQPRPVAQPFSVVSATFGTFHEDGTELTVSTQGGAAGQAVVLTIRGRGEGDAVQFVRPPSGCTLTNELTAAECVLTGPGVELSFTVDVPWGQYKKSHVYVGTHTEGDGTLVVTAPSLTES
ncbi:MAG: hypothetical protein ACTHOK_04635 [Nocardioidaceae bacterium]